MPLADHEVHWTVTHPGSRRQVQGKKILFMFEACMDCRIQGKFIHYFPGGGGMNFVVCKVRYFVCCKHVVQFVFQVTFSMYVRVSGLLTANFTFV